MITISLDEYGEFEKDNNKPLFIGGVIYNDREDPNEILAGGKSEEETERERIRAYYRRAVAEAGDGFIYPEDLHSNGNSDRDHWVVAPVKAKVNETMPEFIAKGTYRGQPLFNEYGKRIRDRRGSYSLFVMLKSDDGKKRLLSENANMLANDNWAANRYFHMASSVVNRIIFHNPFYQQGKIPAIYIDIATRSTGNIDSMDSKLADEFKKQAYKVKDSEKSGKSFYNIMDADIYRTLIAQEMVSSGNLSVKIERLFVSSIRYISGCSKMEFLYLSDSLCSMLGYKLEGNSADHWLTQITDRMKKINPDEKNMFLGYDEIDNLFSKAWQHYENKEFFEALSAAFDITLEKGKFADYYREAWLPYLEERIRESVSPDTFTKTVNRLHAMLTINNLDQDRLYYILKQCEAMVDCVCDRYRSNDMRSVILYRLYDAGITAACHIGDSVMALQYYEKCKQYAFYIDIDAYLDSVNKLIVCLEDSFEWDRALEIASKNIENQQLVSELKREVLNQTGDTGFYAEAKAISQKARILAEKRAGNTEACFRKALAMFEKGSANYKITQSFLLHYYADMGMKEAFDLEVTDYFDGRQTLSQRLRYITGAEKEHDNLSHEYALYVLIRGIYCFHQEKIDDALWDKLRGIDETVKKNTGRAPGGHPWEMIYKYLLILADKRQDTLAQKKFAALKKTCMFYKGPIAKAIDLFGEAEIANESGQIRRRDEITRELAAYLKTNFESMRYTDFPSEGNQRYEILQQTCFTFMYR